MFQCHHLEFVAYTDPAPDHHRGMIITLIFRVRISMLLFITDLFGSFPFLLKENKTFFLHLFTSLHLWKKSPVSEELLTSTGHDDGGMHLEMQKLLPNRSLQSWSEILIHTG